MYRSFVYFSFKTRIGFVFVVIYVNSPVYADRRGIGGGYLLQTLNLPRLFSFKSFGNKEVTNQKSS